MSDKMNISPLKRKLIVCIILILAMPAFYGQVLRFDFVSPAITFMLPIYGLDEGGFQRSNVMLHILNTWHIFPFQLIVINKKTAKKGTPAVQLS